MENNNNISPGIISNRGPTEEEMKARERRMKEKWEFARSIEHDARLIEAEIFRRITAEGGLGEFENYDLVGVSETLKNLTAAVSQAEAFAHIPTYSLSEGWGGCAEE